MFSWLSFLRKSLQDRKLGVGVTEKGVTMGMNFGLYDVGSCVSGQSRGSDLLLVSK